ncbi:IS5/IS1182 family transposase [Chromobacterium subtsugae]|uniref:IS5/IS1182 family transposase n=1 Tax=Chromobacterium subtsugae TaxID=251747 RepID=A0ABS7FBW9_9NEIS|nr:MULTISPECIES: IS5/IS1182 family transposase [Chromobacterium]KUM03065.1 hypothetical protein Cv017_21960 [Chromobacterium subtsugae]KZE84192.1 hypothetical protein AWB61_21605 [Chromobacterium sp. F49]MBW7568534.1 IS5/IS1182 family transposase [Chromobacterium subtsugae]MBW8287569.1 IS5/IS1182 family transposase [Chromobacterium subtsugae]WSE93880.1 IS5/IS1182 family transposase [Chromobacterium subtsugae]
MRVRISYRRSNGPRHLLVDSTGIQFHDEGEGKRKKYGAEYRRQWRKVHLGINAEALEIRAIEVSGNGVGDAPILPELLMQLPADKPIATATLDGAYDTQGCYAALLGRGIMPVTPPRKSVN